MSTRTSMTVLNQGAFPEVGPATKTFESLDVTLGNKVPMEEHLVLSLFNSSVASKTITFTYDDDAGQVRTVVLTLATLETVVAQLPARLGRHAADVAEAGFAHFTANGSAGDVKGRVTRLRYPLNP